MLRGPVHWEYSLASPVFAPPDSTRKRSPGSPVKTSSNHIREENCSPSSSRLYIVWAFRGLKKAKESRDERPAATRFIAFAPNFHLFLVMHCTRGINESWVHQLSVSGIETHQLRRTDDFVSKRCKPLYCNCTLHRANFGEVMLYMKIWVIRQNGWYFKEISSFSP